MCCNNKLYRDVFERYRNSDALNAAAVAKNIACATCSLKDCRKYAETVKSTTNDIKNEFSNSDIKNEFAVAVPAWYDVVYIGGRAVGKTEYLQYLEERSTSNCKGCINKNDCPDYDGNGCSNKIIKSRSCIIKCDPKIHVKPGKMFMKCEYCTLYKDCKEGHTKKELCAAFTLTVITEEANYNE